MGRHALVTPPCCGAGPPARHVRAREQKKLTPFSTSSPSLPSLPLSPSDLQGPRPAGWPEDAACYRVLITPTTEGGDAAASDEKQLDLVFAYPPLYPDTPPLLKPRSVRGLSSAELADVLAACDGAVEANAGMPMMYAVISACQDWLRSVVGRGLGGGDDGVGAGAGGGAGDAGDSSEAAAAAARLAAAEAEEARLAAARALGTPVTPASFAAWRARFDAEMAAARAARGGGGDAAAAVAAAAATAAAAPRSGTGVGAGPSGRAYFQALDAGAAAAEGGDGGDGDDDGGQFPQEEEEADEEEEEEEEEDVSDLSEEDLDELNELLAQATKVAD